MKIKMTKVVCTIGPKTESVEMLTKLVESGMNVMRLNFSHGDFEEHGARIKNIVDELNGERIDIVEWKPVVEEFVSAVLSPAVVSNVTILEDGTARVLVEPSQLSLAIGKNGQNARLAARLTGMRVDIKVIDNETLKEEENE